MKLGISSYTFGWAVGVNGYRPMRPLDENGLLDKARDLGVKLLQIGDNIPLHKFEPERLSRLAERASGAKVQLEVGARGLTTARATEYIGIARVLNATLVRFVIDEGKYYPDPKTVVAVLRKIAPLLGELRVGIENHDRFSAATLREITEKAGSEQVGVCLDTANSLGTGEGIEAVAAMLAPLTVNLHIKDFAIERVPHSMGFAVTGRPAGDGLLNLPALLQRLAPFKRCQTAVLELWTTPEPELERTIAKELAWAVQSLDYLKPFFAKY